MTNPLVGSISAFFPCYNDAPTIATLVRRVARTLPEVVDDFEIVVVDDGSQDDSLAVLRRLQQELPCLRVVVHEENRGYGAALRSGFAAATKEWIFYTDGDGQYDPAEVTRLVRAVTPGIALAQGWKLRRGDGRVRTIVGRTYHHTVARIFGLRVRDTDCDFRLFKRELVEQADLRSESGAICVEMMYRFEQLGAGCVQTPVHHFPRPYGRSEFFRLPHLARTFLELARLWFRLHLRPVASPDLAGGTAAAATARGRTRRVRIAALGAIMLVSLGAHLWGLTRDLPVPDVDERYFVTPAAYMAASGDANPHWFGHPGSTVIYPLALAFRAREVVFHGAPLTGAAPSIAARFETDPGTFYLIGRLWAVLFSLAAIPLVFAIGRRVFGDTVGYLAAAFWAVVPLAVRYGQITRTDSVALFFALLAIWACLRALDEPSPARFVVAGVAAGLGTASRYFLATLAVVLCATWLAAWRAARSGQTVSDSPRRATPVRPSTLALALVVMGATFALTTPYFFLDWHDAVKSLDAEAATRVAAQAHGVLDNLAYYATRAIPGAISWLGVVAAAVGIALTLRRPRAATTLLLVWLACVLIEISTLPLHWDRWVIPAVPVLVLFGVYAVTTVVRTCTDHLRNPVTRRWAFLTAVAAAMLAVAAGPATALVALDRTEAEPSTRAVAGAWIEHHLRAGSGVAVEIKGPDLTDTRYRYVEHYALASAGTVADYAHAGYRYLVINAGVARRFLTRSHQYPAQAAFYHYLRDDTRRLADFRRGPAHGGPHLELYDLGSRRAEPRDRWDSDSRGDQATLLLSANNRAAHRTGPVPFARRELHRLWLEHCRAAATGAVPSTRWNEHETTPGTTRQARCRWWPN